MTNEEELIALVAAGPWHVTLTAYSSVRDGEASLSLHRSGEPVHVELVCTGTKRICGDVSAGPYDLVVEHLPAGPWSIASSDGRFRIEATRVARRRPEPPGVDDPLAAIAAAPDPRVRDAMTFALTTWTGVRYRHTELAPASTSEPRVVMEVVRAMFEDLRGETIRAIVDGRADELRWTYGDEPW